MEHYCKDKMFEPSWFSFGKLYSFMVDRYPSGSHFVEIGSWKGCSSSYMAVEIHNSGKNIKFDCVDTWQGTQIGDDKSIHEQDPDVAAGVLYERFLSNIDRVKQYINPVRMDSAEAAKNYKDESLDFVFVDADHTYNGVMRDLNAWVPKIRVGGIIAGHDYAWCEDVRRAVCDFFGCDDATAPWNEGCWWVIRQ
jgi:cephalosporin hydroxylase